MAIVYNTTVKNARLQAVVTALGNNAKMVIGTSALAGGATGVLAEIVLANPPATIAGGVLTVAGVPRSGIATGAGNAAKAELRTSADVVIASDLNVGLDGSGAEVIINAIAVSVGQSVQVNAGTITHG